MEITKEMREGKEIYAQRKNYENAELAVLNGATEEQAQAIVRFAEIGTISIGTEAAFFTLSPVMPRRLGSC